ncbi:potassium-transporting ATPase subunit KdpA [Methanospirillum sp. J.3.6.1-F.2.7.3]|uniref:Potassium-transporting ATPase subunit KdpA n=1 Tax=Methanospirillum purgamenti TaxID=2834276 RepID=A0A8E7EIR1_9EURY|nr:potassium-transporting ATPase subunit KdpA [Methanospirillum sp. J.3.6.1-F.2.7.3]
MTGHVVENFLFANTEICVTKEVMRGFTRKEICKLGIYWVDHTRTVFYSSSHWLVSLQCFSYPNISIEKQDQTLSKINLLKNITSHSNTLPGSGSTNNKI